WVFLRGQPNQQKTGRIGVSGNRHALQAALAPVLYEGCDSHELCSRDRIVHGDAVLPGGRDGHGGERVVVAGHARRLLGERGVGPLEQGDAPFDRSPNRGSRLRLHHLPRGCTAPLAPAFTSNSTTCAWPPRFAKSRAVSPLAHFALTSALWS